MSAILLWSLMAQADATPSRYFVIERLKTPLVNQTYELNATINYRFSDEVLEALNNGIPLTVVLDIEVIRKRHYLWNEKFTNLRRRYRLQFHALSRQYVLSDLNTGSQYNYLTKNSAIRALGNISRLPLLDARLLEPDKDYQIRLHAHIDREELPPPLRPMAYISPKWRLTDKWQTWPLQR